MKSLAQAYPTLEPDTIALLDQANGASAPALSTMTLAEARAGATAYLASTAASWPANDQIRKQTMHVPAAGCDIHMYEPESATESQGIVVWFHGGGWVFGSAELHEPCARELCARSRCVILDVDYPLAPEHSFPLPVECGWQVLEWIESGGSSVRGSSRILVGGESSGAHIAIGVCLLARQRQGPRIDGQVLSMPIGTLDRGFNSSSREQFNDPRLLLTQADVNWFIDHYYRTSDVSYFELAHPIRIRAPAELPPATVIAAECDLLRDDAKAYATLLRRAGVQVDLQIVPGAIHNSLEWGLITRAGERCVSALARALSANT